MSGFSLIEAVVALALTASVSAGLIPAIALASRLHRDSAVETESAIAAASRLARLASDVETGAVDTGGRIDAGAAGWQQFVDRSGAAVDAAAASYEVRWQVARASAPDGVCVITVRVIPLAHRGAGVILSSVVPDG